MDLHTHGLTVQAHSHSARTLSCSSLFISLITTSAMEAESKGKTCYNIKARVFFIFSSVLRPIRLLPRAPDTSNPCGPCYHNQGIKLPTAKNSFLSRLPTEIFTGFIDLPDNQQLYAIKPFTAKIVHPAYVMMIHFLATSWTKCLLIHLVNVIW